MDVFELSRMEEESVSSMESTCSDGEVPDLNALLISDHIVLTEDHANNSDNEKEKKCTPKQSIIEEKASNNRQYRIGPNLLSKSMLAKLRKADPNRREDPLKRIRQFSRQQERGKSRDNKAIVVINIQDMGGGFQDYSTPGTVGPNLHARRSLFPGGPVIPSTRGMSPTSQWEHASQRVNLAFEHVQKVANRQRDDQLSGLPTNAFQLMEPQGPQLKVVTEIKASVYNRRKRQQKRMQEEVHNEEISKDSKKTPESLKHNIPNGFVFPKEENFIREKTKIEKIGVDWQISNDKDSLVNGDSLSVSSQSEPFKPRSRPNPPPPPLSLGPRRNSTIPGRLCRTSYPVTEALHRHGTSITKLRGKTLQPGDINVSKVWPRKLDTNSHTKVTPIEMALKDVPSDGFIFKVSVEKHMM